MVTRILSNSIDVFIRVEQWLKDCRSKKIVKENLLKKFFKKFIKIFVKKNPSKQTLSKITPRTPSNKLKQ